jgi:hypothetical protein
MRQQMLPLVVLSRMRSRDEAHVLPVDSNPEERVTVMRLVKKVGIEKEIVSIFESIQTTFKRQERYRGTTNIGGVLAYAKRISLTLQEERTRAEANGKSLPAASPVIVTIFTDGKKEGPQARPP